MKILINSILIIIIALTSKNNTFADSPITSTDFFSVYDDVDMVNKAERSGIINEEIAKYLLSSKYSIGKKAAICNALSWSIDGKKNADIFTNFLAKKYKTTKKDLNLDDLEADELLCLGYLMVLDNYFEPKPALNILDKAKIKNPTSFTINIIYALVQSQIYLDDGKWCKIWVICDNVRNNNSLKNDMRNKAVDVIFEYIDTYQTDCK